MRKTLLLCFLFALLYAQQCELNELDTCTNHICNGGFESPVQRGRFKFFNTIPCWTTNKGNQFQIGFYNGQFPGSQFLELDASKGGQHYQQKIQIDEGGKYYLEFEYHTRAGVNLQDQAFSVNFNSIEVAYITPSEYGRKKIKVDVKCDEGENVLTVQDRGTGNNYGNGVDNFALYKISHIAVA